MTRDIKRARPWGLASSLAMGALIVVGSRNVVRFDAALIGYTASVLFATFGLTYCYTMWLQRPPTAMYWRRGWGTEARARRASGARHVLPFAVTLLAGSGALAGAAAADAHPSRSAGAAVHEELRAATPGDGDTLAVAPRALRLTFVNPVDVSLAHLELTGPAGPVALDALHRAAEAANVLVGPIRGALVEGTYTVRWQVAGPDGHPVRGEFTFTIRPGAEGLATTEAPPAVVDPADSMTTEAAARAADGEAAGSFPASDFDSGSPLYATVRWLTFAGVLGTIGVVAFRLLVLSLLGRAKDPSGQTIIPAASARAVRVGLAAIAVLALALPLRLYAQAYALHGPAGALDPASLGALLGGTTWGAGWWLQAAGTALALIGFVLAGRRARAGWGLAAAGAIALAFSPALSGHAAAVAGLAPLAVAADGLHVLGAGGWLGSLLVVVVAGLPVALRRAEGGGAAVGALINAFSPTALFFAGVVIATGVFSAWLHVGTIPALWSSDYGRTLLLKLGVLSLLFATGAYNWLRVRPALGDPAAAGRLRRSATFELVVSLLVLAVTAVLVATPPVV